MTWNGSKWLFWRRASIRARHPAPGSWGASSTSWLGTPRLRLTSGTGSSLRWASLSKWNLVGLSKPYDDPLNHFLLLPIIAIETCSSSLNYEYSTRRSYLCLYLWSGTLWNGGILCPNYACLLGLSVFVPGSTAMVHFPSLFGWIDIWHQTIYRLAGFKQNIWK